MREQNHRLTLEDVEEWIHLSSLIRHVQWELMVFSAAVIGIAALAVRELFVLTESHMLAITAIEFLVVLVFLADIVKKARHWHGSSIRFVKKNWIDFLAIIPLFRFMRIARFARFGAFAEAEMMARASRVSHLEKLDKLDEIVRLAKVRRKKGLF